ncbi:MAG: hypothetical protein GY906_22540 [bacterium]|nr:hypothetical protein [bacterium]
MGQPSSDYDEYYARKLEQGAEYEDFVTELLCAHGIAIVPYKSKLYQDDKGENRAGFEIKFDRLLAETRNVFIEVQEKSHPENEHWIDSGIFRNDNGWLYIIGNHDIVFVFSKKQLQEASRSHKIIENSTHTGRGFVLSRAAATSMSLKVFRPKDAGIYPIS